MSGLTIVSKADLRDQIVSWLAEDAIDVEDLNRAVGFCEARLRRQLRVLEREVTVDLTLAAETLTVPGRFISARRLYVPGKRPMVVRSPEALIEHQVSNAGCGETSTYSLEGREDGLPFFRFSAIPTGSSTLRLTYIADSSLSSDDDCNDVLDRWPDVYFYGTLYHMLPFLRNLERMPDVEALYDNALEEIVTADVRDKVDGSRLVARGPQRPA